MIGPSEGGVANPPSITLIPSRRRNGNTGIMFLDPNELMCRDKEIDAIPDRC